MRIPRSAWLVVLFLSMAPALASAKPVDSCKAAVFQLLTKTTGYLTCERGLKVITTQNAEIFDVTPKTTDPMDPRRVAEHITLTAPPAGMQSSSASWQMPLEAGKVYALRIAGGDLTIRDQSGPVKTPDEGWAPVVAQFRTDKKVIFYPSKDGPDHIFFLKAGVALKACGSGQVPVLVETRTGGRKVEHDATMQPDSVLSPGATETPTPRCLAVSKDDNGAPTFNPARVGDATITLSRGRFRQDKVRLALTGVSDIFDQPVSIPDKPVGVGSVPADKDASSYFLQASYQAGPDAKPAYSFDAKFAPILSTPVWGDWEPTVLADVDVGFGDTESANSVALGGGLTYLHLTRSHPITALRITTSGKLEADKTFHDKRNLVFQPDLRFYLPFLDNSRSRQARRLYVDEWAKAATQDREDVDPDDYSVDWGFSGQLSLGAELGGALGEPTVETDDKSSSVVVAAHGIARITPLVTGTVEYKRASISVSVTPRFLIATEKAGRIVPGVDASGQPVDQAQLADVSGWKVHSETTLAIGIDRSGHIALSFAYKRGPDAPTFGKVNTFQSGLTIKY